MLYPNNEQIIEIAGNLDVGFICYFNTKTGEIETVINQENWEYGDTEAWSDTIEKIELNREDYLEFEGMSSRDSFEIMAEFANNLDNPHLQKVLIGALEKKHPFRNFKWQVDNSGEYRQKWFDFKKQKYIEWVEEILEVYKTTSD